MAASTVLCVDPDASARADTCAALQEGTELAVVGCDSLSAARESLVPSVGCVVTEYELPGGTGVELAAHVRELEPDTACILFSAVDPATVDTTGAGSVVAEYVEKGANGALESLVALVNHAVAHRTQTAYPVPPDEAARLEALEQYVEDPVELGSSLDRLTTLAASTFDVPMAVISVVDEREQRFLSCFGVEAPTLEREETVCTYAMLESGVTVIEDLWSDPRFADNAGLREAGLRSYASTNITTDEGHVLGTFCLYDGEPRDYDEAERERLALFADEAMEQLELRRQLAAGNDDD